MILAPVRQVDVALEGELAPLEIVAGEGGIRVVFWLASVPLGEYYLHPSELPLSPAQVATLAANATAVTVRHRLAHDACTPHEGQVTEPPVTEAPLARLSERLPRPEHGADLAARTTVVVVTRDRSRSLRRCLAALGTLDPAPRAVLVADNSPEGSAQPVVDDYAGVTRLHVPRGALAHARNAAVREVTDDFIAFTDDDVTVPAGWLGTLVAPFVDERIGSTTGLVLAADLASEPAVVFERRLAYLHKGFRPVRYTPAFVERGPDRDIAPAVWRIGAGASFALRRSAFAEVGAFDDRLGAGAAGCSEDSEWWYRLLRAGWHCRYEPAAFVRHHHRDTPDDLVAQARAYMRGHVVALAVQHLRAHDDPRHLGRIRRELPRALLDEVVSAAVGGRLRRRVVRAQIRGYAEGVLRARELVSARKRR